MILPDAMCLYSTAPFKIGSIILFQSVWPLEFDQLFDLFCRSAAQFKQPMPVCEPSPVPALLCELQFGCVKPRCRIGQLLQSCKWGILSSNLNCRPRNRSRNLHGLSRAPPSSHSSPVEWGKLGIRRWEMAWARGTMGGRFSVVARNVSTVERWDLTKRCGVAFSLPPSWNFLSK